MKAFINGFMGVMAGFGLIGVVVMITGSHRETNKKIDSIKSDLEDQTETILHAIYRKL